jgi:hypothetical protein
MSQPKTHYSVTEYGSDAALAQWKIEGLIPNKVKLCDGLMLKDNRIYDFTKNTDDVNCKHCLRKIEKYHINGFNLPD